MTIGARMKLVVTACTISEYVKTYSHCASDRLGGSTAGGDHGSSGFTSDHMTAMNSGTAVQNDQQRDDEQRDEVPEARAAGVARGAEHGDARRVIGPSLDGARGARIDRDEDAAR